MTPFIISLVLQFSAQYGLDPHIVMAVIANESSFNVKAVGEFGEIGLMQLMPKYFPKYTEQQLFNPRINLRLGIKHLAEAKKSCRHQEDITWIVCYNMGVSAGNKINHPKLFKYYKRVYPIYKGLRMFTAGQKVIVLKAHVNGANDEGSVVKQVMTPKHQAGKYLVDMGYTKILVEPERLVDYDQYAAEQKKQAEKEWHLLRYK